MILFLFLVCSISFLLYSWIKLIKDTKSVQFPGPSPWPILGNGHLFFGDSHNFLKALSNLAKTYGGAYRIHILSNRYIVLSDPEYIQAVTTNSELNTKGDTYKFLFPWLGQGLLTANGNRWQTHRKFLTPAFHFNCLQSILPIFLKNEKILIKNLEKLADGRTLDILGIVALTALDNMTESTMGVSFNCQLDNESEYLQAIDRISKIVSLRMRNGLLAEDAIFNLTSHRKVQNNALKVLHYQSRKAIETRKQTLKNINTAEIETNSEEGAKNKHAFLDSLLFAKIDDESIREEVDTFMFEGHDTTSAGIAYCLYCLSNNSHIQDKILIEQRNIIGDDLKKEPTYQDIQQMKYLDKVIKESLRIYPSVPLIERTTTKDTEIAGAFVPKDTAILIDIINMQRNPKYFDSPLEFRPERFDGNLKHPFSWLAFSAGPRNCIGQKFAMLELKATIAAVLKEFVILPSGIEPKIGADLILKSENGVTIKLKPRVHVD